MEEISAMFKDIKDTGKKYIAAIVFLLLMLLIHRYVFLYADDLYYSRDASAGIRYLPHFIAGQLNSNGRIWVHLLLLGLVKYNVYLFRIVNPFVITLVALLIAKMGLNLDYTNKEFIIAAACACMIFLFLPIEIANTSIYYAADALNYLYAPGVTMLFAYLLYKDYSLNDGHKVKPLILLLSFLAGSSTQQAGMIAIGFGILIPLYFKIFENIRFKKSLALYYLSLLSGYSIVTYGSIKRIFFEKTTGRGVNIKSAATALLKTNIFSIPVSGYVLALCVCSIFYLLHYSKSAGKKNKTGIFMLCLLVLAYLGYVYVVIYKKYNMVIFASDTTNTMLRLSFIAFAFVYLAALFYVSALILLRERFPIPLLCTINAFGAQIMLLVVDARFAGSFRCMFPSLLLMSVFIVYSFIKFCSSKLFLLSFLLSFGFSFYGEYCKKILSTKSLPYNLTASKALIILLIFLLLMLVIMFVLHKTLFKDMQPLRSVIFAAIIMLSLCFWGVNYMGYKAASYAQNFNLNAINEYHKSSNKSVLKLKKVPITIYGYSVGNWNDMPYYMKQCYKINENTVIQY